MANKELMRTSNAALIAQGYATAPGFHGLKRVFVAPEGSPFAGKLVAVKSTSDEYIAFKRQVANGVVWRTLDEGVDFVAVLQEGDDHLTVYKAAVVKKAFEKAHEAHVGRGNQAVDGMSMWAAVSSFGKPVGQIEVPDVDLSSPIMRTHTVGSVVIEARQNGGYTVLVNGEPVNARQHLIRICDAMGLPSKTHDTTRSLGGQIFDALPPVAPPAPPVMTETPGDVMTRCRGEIAQAFGVDPDQVKVSVSS